MPRSGRPGNAPAASARRGPIPPVAGIGLRFCHHAEVVETRPDVGWLEVHSENYMSAAPLACLETIRRDYPVSLHGVGLSLGSAEGIDAAHLARVAALATRIEPVLVSEHLSWSAAGGTYLADLLPLPLTEEALDIVGRHVDAMQAALRRPVLIENPSTYLRYSHSTIPEPEFLAALAQRTGCGILCDVNNLYVSACNHGFDARDYLASLPASAVAEFHLAGHSLRKFSGGKTLRIDDHGSRVCADVWALYAEALDRFGPRPTLVEWDSDIPSLHVLLAEAALASAALQRVSTEASVAFAA